jgi:hypothetical protein
VPLTNGMDVITLHATDLAGNVTTLATGLTVDYSGKTNPPAVQLLRPQDGIGDLRQQHRVPGPFEIRMATNGEA